jgi:hypothetical protein
MSEKDAVASSLTETLQKIESAVCDKVAAHRQDGLDYFDVKTTLMMSHLIDWVQIVKARLQGEDIDDDLMARFNLNKTILQKWTSLDQKLRYQIDKLLGLANQTSLASRTVQEDPLNYGPDMSALRDDNESSSDEDDDGAEQGNEAGNIDSNDDNDDNEDASDKEDNLDDDIKAARMTLAMAKSYKTDKTTDSNIYKPPRLAAVPFTNDKDKKIRDRSKRHQQTSELAQTLRAQFTEAPEQDDAQTNQAARKWADQQAAKRRYEEDAMIRLTKTRKEKTIEKKIRRMEASNLSSIADLSNIVRDVKASQTSKRRSYNDNEPVDHEPKRKRKEFKASNKLQADLFGGDKRSSKKKSSGKKQRR